MKFSSLLPKLSLRWKIMLCVAIAMTLLGSILIVSMSMNLQAMRSLGGSYISNSELNDFSQKILQTEKAVETYINYRTFESIDSFYNFRNKVEISIEKFQKYPSTNEVKQKEYIVAQLTKSYISYGTKAIASQRANSHDEVAKWFDKALSCYNLLNSHIIELNSLRLQENANNYETNRRNFSFSTSISIVLFIVCSSIILLILYIIITSLTKPLVEISEVAHRVSKRDFDVPLFNLKSDDEIGNICQAFDRMIISIREYIDTIWEKAQTEAELREKEIEMQALYTDAQLKTLQYQINPHFLFNTLNTGAQLAMMENADKTCLFMEQVADFFRYNIQQKKQTATIDEELGLIDNFVYIMKVRFGNRLEFKKTIPEQKLNQTIPVMTLQPLVENCIKHGLKNSKGKIELKITMLEKFIEISVSDNGSGMDEEVRKKVLEMVKSNSSEFNVEENSEEGTGIGLTNVFMRLKLYFHRDDIFDIVSADDGIGTKFIIRIPAHV